MEMSIQSFASEKVKSFYLTGKVGKKLSWFSIKKVILRKLDMLEYANDLNDLRSPPGNRLEKLKGDLAGQCSIRVNDQWRIVFKWTELGPEEVDVIDYH